VNRCKAYAKVKRKKGAYYNNTYNKLTWKQRIEDMAKEIAVIKDRRQLDSLIKLVTDGLTSEVSRTMYAHNLNDFIDWYLQSGNSGLSKATVNQYKVYLQDKGFSPSTINQRLSAVRRMAREASDNNLMPMQLAQGIMNVQGVKTAGVRLGNWLTLEQAQSLLTCHDLNTLKGLRDRAVLAVMLGGGLRRSEVSKLTFDLIQQRAGRWVIVDLVGKGNRVRSIGIKAWVKQAIDEWSEASGITEGFVFVSINRGGNLSGDSISSQAIQDIVKQSAKKCGLDISAHDLRRTYAKLSRKGGADMKQIQLSLGHATILTTERYLGIEQDLSNAPSDFIELKLNSPSY